MDGVCNVRCVTMQTLTVSSPFYRAPHLPCAFPREEESREPHETAKAARTTPETQACHQCDGADPALGGHELGTTATEPSFFAAIHALLCLSAKILCQSWQFIPASSGISVLLVICHWIKFLCKVFISYCGPVYWGHPRLTCKTAGNGFLAHSVIPTRGFIS